MLFCDGLFVIFSLSILSFRFLINENNILEAYLLMSSMELRYPKKKKKESFLIHIQVTIWCNDNSSNKRVCGLIENECICSYYPLGVWELGET